MCMSVLQIIKITNENLKECPNMNVSLWKRDTGLDVQYCQTVALGLIITIGKYIY